MRNMKNFTTAGAILLMTTSLATAGGLDRSGQGIGVIFEDGDYAELSYGSISPSLSGSGINGARTGPATTGDIAPTYTQLGMAYKTQVTDQVSLALIFDQPFGADVDYGPFDPTGGSYILSGYNAQVETDGVTALARYEINPSFSVHGGMRYIQASGVYDIVEYESNYASDGGFGYVLGAAYERDDIAMRVALTYSSEIDLTLQGDVGGNTLTTTLPESINLDFQTGIAADTLLFGSVRYVAWDGFALVDSNDPSRTGSILSYDDDVYTYNVGVGRRITDALSASFAVGYEKSTGEITGNLGPTDGFISYQVGAAYLMDNGIEVSGGVRYINIGDATTETVNGQFNDNDAVAVGLKIGYTF
jgi:long-chain fatty acid transport protein